MTSIDDIFEHRNRLCLALYILEQNGGIGPEWMFDDARNAMHGMMKRLPDILQKAIDLEEEFDGEPTERSIELRRLLAEYAP